MRLAFQIIAALIVGVCYYMLAMAMTVYDGILSIMFQPFIGSILTLIAIVILLVVGLPLRLVEDFIMDCIDDQTIFWEFQIQTTQSHLHAIGGTTLNGAIQQGCVARPPLLVNLLQ